MPVLSAHRLSPPRPARPVQYALVAVTVAVAAGVLWLSLPRLEERSTVDLSVRNDLPYHVGMDVRRPGEQATLLLGLSEAGTSREFHQVLDRGDTWVFTFSYGGQEAASVEVTRDELEDSGWTIDVPESAAAVLQGAGFEPPP